MNLGWDAKTMQPSGGTLAARPWRLALATVLAVASLLSVHPHQTFAAPSNDVAFAIARQNDGKLVLVGSASNGTDRDLALVRYNADGTLDGSFGAGGRVVTNLGGDEVLFDVAIQTDGKIVAVGFRATSGNRDFLVVRYTSTGAPDPGFDGDGVVTTDFGGDEDTAEGVAIQTDGKIVVVGLTGDVGTSDDFALVRYKGNGAPDEDFDGDGKLTTDFDSDDDAFDVAIQTDGKIVVVGRTGGGDSDDFAIARYNTNGSVDSQFADGFGLLAIDFGKDDEAVAVKIQPDGKIVVAGDTANEDDVLNSTLVLRLASNGDFDPSFGSGTSATGGSLFGLDEDITALTLQSDGKIMLAGRVGPSADDFFLVRINPGGTLDASFAKEGFTAVGFSDAAEIDDEATGIVTEGVGKKTLIIAAGGTGPVGESHDFAVTRLKSKGKVDKKFGGKVARGLVTTDLNNLSAARPDRTLRPERRGDGDGDMRGDHGSEASIPSNHRQATGWGPVRPVGVRR